MTPPTSAIGQIPIFADLVSGTDPHPATHAIRDGVPAVSGGNLPPASGLALDVDWAQVQVLRRRASELIADEQRHRATSGDDRLVGDDRVLMGRSIIRGVVADHVRTLHREGARLWSAAEEQAYVDAVEDAVFGYGRLQPLLDLADVENIEIHGWDSVVVQFGDGRRRQMPPIADSDAELVEAVRFLGQNGDPSRRHGNAVDHALALCRVDHGPARGSGRTERGALDG